MPEDEGGVRVLKGVLRRLKTWTAAQQEPGAGCVGFVPDGMQCAAYAVLKHSIYILFRRVCQPAGPADSRPRDPGAVQFRGTQAWQAQRQAFPKGATHV